MVAVLFLVGKRLEDPSVVSDLLDISKHPDDAGRPVYEMASELPLVLVDCGYSDGWFDWRYEDCDDKDSNDGRVQVKVMDRLWGLWEEASSKSMLISSMMNKMECDVDEMIKAMKVAGFARAGKPRNYVKLMQRHRCDSLQARKEKGILQQAKKTGKKRAREEDGDDQ